MHLDMHFATSTPLKRYKRYKHAYTSMVPHDFCAWRVVNGFLTVRPKNGWAARERVRRCTTQLHLLEAHDSSRDDIHIIIDEKCTHYT